MFPLIFEIKLNDKPFIDVKSETEFPTILTTENDISENTSHVDNKTTKFTDLFENINENDNKVKEMMNCHMDG